MKFFVFLITISFYIKCNADSNFNALKNDEIIIPIEIISNYLYKCLSRENVFLSIVCPNSSYTHFQNDLIRHLISNPELSNFSYNILNEVDQTRQGNINAFNVIIVDGIVSLL